MRVQRNLPTLLFLSTLSLRRATGCNIVAQSTPVISIHALLAESDATAVKQTPLANISIHALLAESDFDYCLLIRVTKFLSTLSLRRATCDHTIYRKRTSISIHALLAESDNRRNDHLLPTRNFYPRSPCGERL